MSYVKFECATGMALILLFHVGSKYVLGTDGNLDLPPSLDADPEPLLPEGTLCVLFTKRECAFFSRFLPNSLFHPNY